MTGFDRENLYFDVETIKKKDDYVLEYVRNHQDDSGIIYCATRKM
jgi:ATP-dependent DNA helicase RecQ